MRLMKLTTVLATSLLVSSCATKAPVPNFEDDLGLLWVKNAAEYEAISLQAYRAAERDLAEFIEDTSWSALPWQKDAAGLPPAVILDVDETVASNIDFQMTFEPPFTNMKHYEWSRDNDALPIRGVASFISKAREAGVTVFFVTNRPCEAIGDDSCPQRTATIGDIAEAGIETDAEYVLLSQERGWTREKSTRRAYVAENYRVIMLFGDDLGDFLPCIRSKIYAPCTEAATAASRSRDVEQHRNYWGSGWYVLPNPMHGSWTSAH